MFQLIPTLKQASRNKRKCCQIGIYNKTSRIRKKKLRQNTRLYRTGWSFIASPGPWDNEYVNLHTWRSEQGYVCTVRRNLALGNWCGYVSVSSDHPLYGKDPEEPIPELEWIIKKKPFQDKEAVPDVIGPFMAIFGDNDWKTAQLALNVHGGITYYGVHPTKENSKLWCFGFDCGHAGDETPIMSSIAFTGTPKPFIDTYRTYPYVKSQCEELAKQLKHIENVLQPIIKEAKNQGYQ